MRMRNKIIVLLTLLLGVSLFVYGREAKAEKKIRLTDTNFYDYFEFIVFSDSGLKNYTDQDGKTKRVVYGWQLKRELAEQYSHISFLTEPGITMNGQGIQTFRIEFNGEDPDDFTVFEQTGILEEFTQTVYFSIFEVESKEKHYGFFKGALSMGYDKGPVYYADLPEPEQLSVASVHGVLVLHK